MSKRLTDTRSSAIRILHNCLLREARSKSLLPPKQNMHCVRMHFTNVWFAVIIIFLLWLQNAFCAQVRKCSLPIRLPHSVCTGIQDKMKRYCAHNKHQHLCFKRETGERKRTRKSRRRSRRTARNYASSVWLFLLRVPLQRCSRFACVHVCVRDPLQS